MLTPKFELQQNEDFLFVYIYVPYAKVSEVEVDFEDTSFLFYCKPYYLRLNWPAKVVHRESPDVKYDVDKMTLTVKVPKAEPGEHFEGLDLYTSLLNCKKRNDQKAPLIEIIGEADDKSDDNFDFSIEQEPDNNAELSPITSSRNCGFASSYSFSVFNLKEEATEIFDIRDPQMKTAIEQREERLIAEGEKFDEDYCLADLYDDEEIKKLLIYKAEWQHIQSTILKKGSVQLLEETIIFTAEEREHLQMLPNKEYLLDKSQVKALFLGLVDIIFAYAYNIRTVQGENTVESPWTVNKLSATLSWLETFTSIPEVACSCLRRSLCFPLYRHFGLSLTVLKDVRIIFSLGRRCVLKCLLDIHKMFCSSDPRYILNDLYIIDYCIWIQSKKCSSNMFIKLGMLLEEFLKSPDLHLKDFENFAYIAWLDHTGEEGGDSKNVLEQSCDVLSSNESNSQNNSVDDASKSSECNTLCNEFHELNI